MKVTDFKIIFIWLLMGVCCLLLPRWMLFFLTIAFSKCLVVLGVVMLMRAGLVSFGQGLFYAAGAYAVGFGMKDFGIKDAFLLVLLAILSSGAIAAILGLLVARYREIFFAMLNLAFSMVFYGLLLKLYTLTGGTDGIGIRPPTFLLLAPNKQHLPIVFYIFALLWFGASFYVIQRFFKSPLGYLTLAIRDNEIRVEYLGTSVRRVVYTVYVIAGVLSGIGGALVAFTVGHIVPEFTYWTVSGEFVFIALLGGIANPVGSLIGTIAFEAIKTLALKSFPYLWQLTMGVAMLVIILFMPEGLWTIYRRMRQHLTSNNR